MLSSAAMGLPRPGARLRALLARLQADDIPRLAGITLAGRRITDDDVIIITAQRFRAQEQNRRDALERLSELVEQARIEPKVRRPTKPTRASKQRRLQNKQQRGQIKKARGAVKDFD